MSEEQCPGPFIEWPKLNLAYVLLYLHGHNINLLHAVG